MVEYLSNKNLLREIHTSKGTYCSYIDPKYAHYDAIVLSKAEITPEVIEASTKSANQNEIVARVMTYEHIPLDPDRKRKSRTTDQSYTRTNFTPFKHYVLRGGNLIEVGRSHWNGDFDNGEFSLDHGHISDNLAKMYLLLVERIARRPNWIGYSYRSEMEGEAIIQLFQNGLLFDESKTRNPFAFLTTVTNNAFLRILNKEKRAQILRDELLELSGLIPSQTRLIEHELRHMPTPPPLPPKAWGRKSAAAK